MRTVKKYSGILALLVALTAATIPAIAGTILGTVTDGSGTPLAGAVVRTDGEPSYSATTGTNGAYSLTLPNGGFVVLASASSYNPKRMSVPSGMGNVNFDLYAASTGQISLPAPLAWGAPPSAPSAPGNSYPVAFADTGALPAPGAPRIADYNECVKPDESFTLAGANFTTRSGADAGTDTTVWVWARTSSSAGTLRQAKVWKVSATTIVATIPSDLPFGMYMVWVENSVGASAPICLNRTTAKWIGPIDNKIYPGGTKRVFGRNLTYGHGVTRAGSSDPVTSYVYIQPSTGGAFIPCPTSTPVPSTAPNLSEPYSVMFTVPSGTANGSYKLYVHNGQGGDYGWSDGLDLVVQNQWVRGTGQIIITSNGIDDTAQIQSAINTVSGYTNGGVVQLGAGNYILKSPISIATNVELKGAGMNSTTLLLEALPNGTEGVPAPNNPTLQAASITVSGSRAALTDLTVHLVRGYGLPTNQFYCTTTYAGVVVSGVRIDSDQGEDTWKNEMCQIWGGGGTEFSGCELHRDVVAQWACWIHDSTLNGDVGPWYMAESCCELFGENNILENNHAETVNWPIVNGSPNYFWQWQDPSDPTSALFYRVWAKRLAICYCNSSYVAHNTTKDVAVDDNRGEMILFHGHGADWCGQVLSNSGLTMTVRTDGTVFGNTYTISNSYGGPFTAGQPVADTWEWWATYNGTRHLIILSGTGAGQVRNIASITAPNKFTVDRPWTVQPDSTSVALFSDCWSENIVYGNNLDAFPVGYSFDSSKDYAQTGTASTGVCIDGNTYRMSAEANISHRTNYGRQIKGNSGGPSLWNVMRDEQSIDCNTSGYNITQLETNPLGPILFGNAFRNCSGNVLNAASTYGFGVLGMGEGSILENLTVTSGMGYYLGSNTHGRTGSPTLYRNNSITANLSPTQPAYVNIVSGDEFLSGNTYPGSAQPYSFNSGTYDLGASSYSMLVPLYKVARFTASSGGGVLSAVVIPIANAGTSPMTWYVVAGSPWISPSIIAGGTVSAEGTSGSLSITPDTTGMTVGRHWGSVTVYTTTGSVNVGVLVDVTSATQVAAPMFSPPAATHVGSQSVAISTTTGGASIRYTTDGSMPTSTTGTVYSGPVSITESTVLQAIAYKSGMADSIVTTIGVAAPTFSLAPGTYGGTRTVTIGTITSGASIRYTTDGTAPTQSVGLVYGGPVDLSSNCTLQAIAYKSGMADSTVTTGLYTIVNQTWSLAGDFSSTTQGNNGWYYGMENYLTRGPQPAYMGLYASPASLYTGTYPDYALDCSPAVIMWGGWGGGICYSRQSTSLSKYPKGQNIGTLAAGKVAMNSGTNNGDNAKARWVASVDGDYTYNVTFSRPVDATNGVYVDWGDLNADTKTVLGTEQFFTTTNSAYSYSGTQHLAAGQFLDFVLDTQDSSNTNTWWNNYLLCLVQVDATIMVGSGSGNTVAKPTFTPTGGSYSSVEMVAMSSTTSGATIRYTTDGTTPTSTAGTIYSSALAISQTTMLKAIAYKSGMTDSAVASATYTIQPLVKNRISDVWSVDDGYLVSLSSAKVAIVASGVYSDGSIYVSESDRTCGMKVLNAGTVNLWDNLTITGSTGTDVVTGEKILRATAVTRGANTPLVTLGIGNTAIVPSGRLVRVWGRVIGVTPGCLTIDDGSGSPVNVETDGLVTPLTWIPSLGDYISATGPAGMMSGKVTAVRVRNQSDIQDCVKCSPPSFSPAPGAYAWPQAVTISSNTGGANIIYTTDGTDPGETNGLAYSGPVSVDQNMTLKAVACKSGLADSTITSGNYTINCAAPTFNPGGGVYGAAQTVTIGTTTSGASIRYTTDGTTPSDTVGTVYSSPVAITQNCTLKAIAYKSNAGKSTVTSGAYSFFIGKNTVGSASQTPGNGTMRAFSFQAGANITVTQMVVDIGTSTSSNIKCAIYSDNGGSPGTFLMGTNQLTSPGTGWKTFTLTSSQSLTSGANYWLVLWTNSGSYRVLGDATGGTYKYRTLTYGSWPTSFGTVTGSGTLNYSIYAQ